HWVGVSGATKDDLLGGQEEDKGALDEAKDFLRDLLADGMVEVESVRKNARQAGIADITLRRAKKDLHVVARHPDIKGPCFWELPRRSSNAQGAQGDQTQKDERLGGSDERLGELVPPPPRLLDDPDEEHFCARHPGKPLIPLEDGRWWCRGMHVVGT